MSPYFSTWCNNACLLSGTVDLKERPLVVFDAASVLKASLDSRQIASVLLYYASLPR
jgi:hypothetical protein